MKTALLTLVSTSLVVVISQVAVAGSATWDLHPSDDQWNTAANWTPDTVPNGPSDTATFDVSTVTHVDLSADIEAAGIIFNPNASSYTIFADQDLNISGEGIMNNSGIEQRFVSFHDGAINFLNGATAGDARFTVRSFATVSFFDTATAGEALIENNGHEITPSITFFLGSSTAGNATIYNYAGNPNGGGTLFMETSHAGTATVISQGTGPGNAGVQFRDQSSADHSTLMAEGGMRPFEPGQLVDFEDDSTADGATAIAYGGTVSRAEGGSINIGDDANAEHALLMAAGGSNGGLPGVIGFYNHARGGKARVELSNGLLRIDGHQPLGVSIGSLNGSGKVSLGANNLTVGGNNVSTLFSGRIQDGDFGIGGSLTKVGQSVLALSGDSTYTGSTVIFDGTLLILNEIGSATGTGDVSVQRGRLSGDGTIAGAVTVGDGDATSAVISPGKDSLTPGSIIIQSNVSFNSDATYQFNLQSNAETASGPSANGVTIDTGALFTASDSGNAKLPPGVAFVVINNTSATPIAGRFGNLPDGATVTVGSNTFQANYEGGDGNDLTLTVVP